MSDWRKPASLQKQLEVYEGMINHFREYRDSGYSPDYTCLGFCAAWALHVGACQYEIPSWLKQAIGEYLPNGWILGPGNYLKDLENPADLVNRRKGVQDRIDILYRMICDIEEKIAGELPASHFPVGYRPAKRGDLIERSDRLFWYGKLEPGRSPPDDSLGKTYAMGAYDGNVGYLKKCPTYKEVCDKVACLFPDAVVDKDLQGQLIVYLGVKRDENGYIVPFTGDAD